MGGDSWRSVKLHLATGQISIRGKKGALELINIPGVSNRKPQADAEKLVLKSAKDIEKALVHLTQKQLSSPSREDQNANSVTDIKRVLEHLTQG